jgi:hypothetical protein
MSKTHENALDRYTTLPFLLDIVERNALFLSETNKWEDKNDVKLLNKYIKFLVYRQTVSRNAKVFAMCFCTGFETIHHWKTFANGPSGCCIQFDRNKILQAVDALDDGSGKLRHGVVQYKQIETVTNNTPPWDSYPFRKRLPYDIEEEYRIIWVGDKSEKTKEIPIALDSITKITFSPQMPRAVFENNRRLLRRLFDRKPKELPINLSTVLENQDWIDAFPDPPLD